MKKDYRILKEMFCIIFLCCAFLISSHVTYGQYNKKGIAPVLVPAGGFHVDGDAYANTPVAGVGDWFEKPGTGGWLINSDGSYAVPVGDGNMTQFYVDVFKAIDPTAFPGTNKINDPPSTYTVGLANVPSKNDMQRAAAHFSFADPSLPGGVEGDLWCMFAADRWEINGESYIDFEFNQAKMELVGGTIKSYAPLTDIDGDPTGGRTPGDILITMYFEKGGKQATLYVDKWEKTGKGGTYLWTRKNVETDFPPNTLFCTENTEVTLAPWPVYDTGGNTYQINQYAEGAINLTRLMAVGETKCGHLSTVWIHTKTSQSSTAELKDLAGPPFQVDLGVPELMAKCPEDPNLPACTKKADIEAAFTAWKSGFTWEGGVEPITVLSGAFPTLPADVDCKGATLTYTYKIKDYCQQTDECTATFTVAPDLLAPVLPKLPEGGDLGCNPTLPTCATGLIAMDDCDGEVQVTCEAGDITGSDCAKQQIFTYRAVDFCGNESSEKVTYTWTEDLEDPVAECPEPRDLGKNPAPGSWAPEMVKWTDNCSIKDEGVIKGTPVADKCNWKVVHVHWAKDECDNYAECEEIITWSVELQCYTVVDKVPEFGGDYGEATVWVTIDGNPANPDDFTYKWFPSGETTRTTYLLTTTGARVLVTDKYGCTTECEVPQQQGPECPEPFNLGCNPVKLPDAELIENDLEAHYGVNITITEINHGDVQGDDCWKKQIWTVAFEDDKGNPAVCDLIYKWKVDKEPPVFTKIEDFWLEGCNPDWPEKLETTWTDNCGVEGELSGNIYSDEGKITWGEPCHQEKTYTFTLTDDCNNTAKMEVIVKRIWDNAPPSLWVPEGGDLGCNPMYVPPKSWRPESFDRCGQTIEELTQGEVIKDGCMRSQTFTFTATDECGNSASESATFTWKEDHTGPVMEPMADLVFACEEPVVIPTPVFNDECDGAITDYTCEVVGYPEADCATFAFPEGETTVCFTAYDECGNSTVQCVKVTVEPCVIKCETAYGRLENERGESLGRCFLDDGFDRWGWTNYIVPSETKYVLPIYAGAAHCDVTNGWGKVGTATIKYFGDKLVVTYEMLPKNSLSEVHVYVGCGKYPKLKSGKETVAPGQYTFNFSALDRASVYTVTFNDVKGPVWVIVHAVVCDVDGKTTGEGSFVKAIDCRPKSATIAGIEATELRVYPNPFDTKVNFEFVSARDAQARLEIFNVTGQKISTLMNHQVERGVLNRIEYQPVDIISGVLFYRLTLDDQIINGKLLYNKQ